MIRIPNAVGNTEAFFKPILLQTVILDLLRINQHINDVVNLSCFNVISTALLGDWLN